MSGRLANPFYTDPTIGGGFANLAAAFGNDPAQESRLAAARLAAAQTGQIEGRMGAARAAGDRLRSGSYSPADLAQVYADALSGGDPALLQAIPALVRGFAAASGADPNRLGQLYVGAGGDYANTEPGFMRTDDTRRRNADVSAGATLGAARIGADGQVRVETLRQAGQDRRMAPEVNPGNMIVVPPTSPLASRADPNGRIQGNPSLPVEQGAAANALRTDPNMPPAEVEANRRVLPGAAAAEIRGPTAARPPMDISGADAAAIDAQLLSLFPAGTALDENATAWLRTRASEAYQQTRNMPAAVAQAVREFQAANPPRLDYSINPFSSRRLGLPPALGGGASSAPTGSADAPSAAAPAAAPAATVPPPGQRVVGRTYPTPRGPMIWTGTGWRPAS